MDAARRSVIRPLSRRARWTLLALATVLLVTLGPALVLAPSPPVGTPRFLANWAYDVRLIAAGPAKAGLSLIRGFRGGWRLLDEPAGRAVLPDGLDLAATIYAPERPTPGPGVLLLHGSTPQGRRLGLYRALAGHLCARGYVVLAPDQRGYGDSADPTRLDLATSFDYVGDARRALEYLGQMGGVDSSRLSVVGHSFGADVAISLGLADPRVRNIVAFAPTRGLLARAGPDDAPQTAYYVRREMRYMKLPRPIPSEVFVAYRLPLALDAHMAALSRPGHTPLLVIEGGGEPAPQRDHFAGLYHRIAAPKAHLVLPQADHYANVADLGPLTVFSQSTMTELTNAVDGFLSPSPGAGPFPCGAA